MRPDNLNKVSPYVAYNLISAFDLERFGPDYNTQIVKSLCSDEIWKSTNNYLMKSGIIIDFDVGFAQTKKGMVECYDFDINDTFFSDGLYDSLESCRRGAFIAALMVLSEAWDEWKMERDIIRIKGAGMHVEEFFEVYGGKWIENVN